MNSNLTSDISEERSTFMAVLRIWVKLEYNYEENLQPDEWAIAKQ